MNQKSRQKATSCVEREFLKHLTTGIMELIAKITLTTVFWNLFMMALLKYLTLKNLQQFSMITNLNTFFSPTLLR